MVSTFAQSLRDSGRLMYGHPSSKQYTLQVFLCQVTEKGKTDAQVMSPQVSVRLLSDEVMKTP